MYQGHPIADRVGVVIAYGQIYYIDLRFISLLDSSNSAVFSIETKNKIPGL